MMHKDAILALARKSGMIIRVIPSYIPGKITFLPVSIEKSVALIDIFFTDFRNFL